MIWFAVMSPTEIKGCVEGVRVIMDWLLIHSALSALVTCTVILIIGPYTLPYTSPSSPCFSYSLSLLM